MERSKNIAIILGLAVMVTLNEAKGQKFTETVTKEYDQYSVFYLANVSGDIEVEGYSGNKIVLEVRKMLDGRNRMDMEDLKQSVVLGEMIRGDSLIIYVKGLGECFCSRESRRNYGGYHYNFNDWDVDFDYNFDFKVKVPEGTHLYLSTINNGDVTVRDVIGDINAKNINGSIVLANIAGGTKAHTINGDVTVDYVSNPKQNSKYYSLNGDIKANFQKDLDAIVSFKSFNGDLYTNINELEYLPTKVKKTEAKSGKGISYKIGDRMEIKIRNGGLFLDFETFNGDVIIKEILE